MVSQEGLVINTCLLFRSDLSVKLSNEILAMILSLLIHLVYEFIFSTFVFDEFSKVDNLIYRKLFYEINNTLKLLQSQEC